MQLVQQEVDTLGLTVPVMVPASVADFDSNAKREGACLKEAINNVIYRSWLADFRDSFTTHVEEKTGIQRKTKTVKRGDKEVAIFDETEGDYMRRVRAEKGWTEDNTQLQEWATEIAKTIDFDASATERKGGVKKLPTQYLEAAKRIITNKTTGNYARFGLTFSGDPAKLEVEAAALGWKIREEVLAKEREMAKQYV